VVRVALLCALLCGCAAKRIPTQSYSLTHTSLTEGVLEFDKSYDRFSRALFGCPATGPADATTCRPSIGGLDLKALDEMVAAFKRTFLQ
jgi:hypothetical protein